VGPLNVGVVVGVWDGVDVEEAVVDGVRVDVWVALGVPEGVGEFKVFVAVWVMKGVGVDVGVRVGVGLSVWEVRVAEGVKVAVKEPGTVVWVAMLGWEVAVGADLLVRVG